MHYSIVMPAHRANRFLVEAVQSALLAMDKDEAELIIVVNGPDSEAIMQLLSDLNLSHNCRIVLSEIQSIAYCLNKGIELARGEYIARFDSDDICMQNRFHRQYEIAVHKRADFLFSEALEIDVDGICLGKVLRVNVDLWRKCGPIHPAAFIKRSVLLELGGYGNLEFGEDYHLWLRASTARYKLEIDHNPVIYYRIHPEQATDKGKLIDTFATNLGVKLTLGLRKKRYSMLVGAALEACSLVYRRCRNAFS